MIGTYLTYVSMYYEFLHCRCLIKKNSWKKPKERPVILCGGPLNTIQCTTHLRAKTSSPWTPWPPASNDSKFKGEFNCLTSRDCAQSLHHRNAFFKYETNKISLFFKLILHAGFRCTHGQKFCFLHWINVLFYHLLHQINVHWPQLSAKSFSLMFPASLSCFGIILDKRGGAPWSPCLQEKLGMVALWL